MVTARQRTAALAALQSGSSFNEAAAAAGVSHMTVRRWAQQAGVGALHRTMLRFSPAVRAATMEVWRGKALADAVLDHGITQQELMRAMRHMDQVRTTGDRPG